MGPELARSYVRGKRKDYCLSKFRGTPIIIFLLIAEETITVSVTIIVNLEEFEELFGMRKDSVMISVNSLLMVGLVSVILVIGKQ